MRINKFLAKTGLGSRRQCDEIIKNKFIKVNGKILIDFSYQVNKNDIIQYKNKYLDIEENNYYFKLNKPRGYICSAVDPQKRKTIYNLIHSNIRLFSIGRLDYDTSGLILLTNNGDFSNFLCHPKNNVVKKYYVNTNKKLNKNQIEEISKGIILDNNDRVNAKIIYCNKKFGNHIWDVHLKEGKNREIKRIFNYFDINVKSIHRYEFGGITINNLPEGKYVKLKPKEVSNIKSTYGYKTK